MYICNIEFDKLKKYIIMAAWYECKVSFTKTLENGKTQKVTELYLVDAVSFTEAEARIYKEIGQLIGEFNLGSVKKARVTELIHNEEAFKWYKAKVNLTSYDEKSGKEMKSNQIILTSADNLRDAYDSVENLFSGTTDDHEIIEVIYTPIMEIFPFFLEENKVNDLENRNLKPISLSNEDSNIDSEIEENNEVQNESNVEENTLEGL